MTPNCSTCKGTSKQVRECLNGFKPAPQYVRTDNRCISPVVIVGAPDSVATSDEQDAFLDGVGDHLPGCGVFGDATKCRFIVKVWPKEMCDE